MAEKKDDNSKKPWKKPEITQIKAEETEANLFGGGDAQTTAS